MVRPRHWLRTWVASWLASLSRRADRAWPNAPFAGSVSSPRASPPHRARVAAASVATALSALVLIGGFVTWLGYRQWRLGYVSFNSDGVLLGADVIDGDGTLAVPRFTISTQAPVSLPTGSYQLRLTG